MALPGIGSIVIYHYDYNSVLLDVPATVLVTPESWVETGQAYELTQPEAGTVCLGYLLPGFPDGSATTVVNNISEGTSAGEYSLISAQTPDVAY